MSHESYESCESLRVCQPAALCFEPQLSAPIRHRMLIAEKATSYSEDSALNRRFKGVYGFAFLAVVSPTGLRYLSWFLIITYISYDTYIMILHKGYINGSYMFESIRL